MSLLRSLLPLLLLAAVAAGPVVASAPPVGPLPAGPVKPIALKSNHTFTITLPKSKDPGLVWRVARAYAGGVVEERTEGETKSSVWLRFRSVAPGKTSLVFALTRGEREHAFAARTFLVTVS